MRVRTPNRGQDARQRREPERAAAPPQVARLLALQRSAGNQAVARAIKHNAKELGTVVYDTEPGTGTVQQLAAVVREVTAVSDLDEADVTLRLSEFDGDDAVDLVYSSIESLVEYLGGEYTAATDDDTGGQKAEKEEKATVGQTVGKLTFPGDTYHLEVKPAVISAIGVRELSFFVYGDTDHHNFNLWFEKNGDIHADRNSTQNSKGPWTGWRWENGKAVQEQVIKRKTGGTKERKGSKDTGW